MFNVVEKSNKNPFTSIQNSQDFKGYSGDADRFAPVEDKEQEYEINRYGIRVRKAKVVKDNDIIQFSVNRG